MNHSKRAALAALAVSAGSLFGFAGVASASDSVQSAEACVGWGAVDSVSYVVDGAPVSSLTAVTEGSTVEAKFTVKSGCTDVAFGLAAYTAPGATWDPNTANKQNLSDSDTGTFSAGAHTLSVTVPECFYQVDFFTGGVIPKLSGTTNYSSEGRLISFQNGGTEECVGPNEVTTTTTAAPTTTTTVAPTTTTTAAVAPNETTVPPTTPDSVLDETVTRGADVADENLARTGSNVDMLMVAGAGLILLGAAATGAAAHRRRLNAQHYA